MSRRRKQNTNIQKVIQRLFRQIWKLAVSFTKSLADWLLRGLLVTRTRQHRQTARAGFVLPTVAMLLVVVTLVIGSILLRTGSRTNQVISERNQQIIYNAATPAVDRAKAKLEYLFKRDDRLPQGTPSESRLMSMLLNDGQNNVDRLPTNPYNLADETRLDLDGGGEDPAWSFKMDTDGNGQPDTTVAYSIIFKTRDTLTNDETNPNPPQAAVDRTKKDQEKAAKLVIRNGPIIAEQAIDPSCQRLNLQPEQGWDLAGTATLLKTFQVTAVVVSNQGSGNRTVVTQEYHQDRELARGNRWGAWFRDDLHLYPGATFNWNGAMHTEGSLIVGGGNTVTGFLISSPKSCVYDPKTNSEVTIRRITSDTQSNTQGLPEFYGQMVNGDLAEDTTGTAGSKFHIQAATPDVESNNVTINEQKDSVSRGRPSEIALDPVKLFTEDISQSRDPGDRSNKNKSIDEWRRSDNPKISNDRIKTISDSKPPYVDDTYRADNRLGPKPRYRIGEGIPDVKLDASRKNGTKIDSAGLTGEQVTRLTTNTVLPTDTQYKKLGLDGYWERRAKLEGLRIIVGPRLELGNPFGWGELRDIDNDGIFGEFGVAGERDPDPLYPIYKAPGLTDVSHQQQQRRTLRDNLAAVQATVVYQNTQDNGDKPLACIATTSHPGTQSTIDNSTYFSRASQYYGGSYPNQPYQLFSDFFTGRGTNGWEYSVPQPGSFNGGALSNAISNLANFAGDYENSNRSGAFPPTQENGRIHPDPYLTMWGNFSNLKRALSPDGNNSIADQSYIHTAGCALGMLAYNVNYFNKYDYTADTVATGTLRSALRELFTNNRVVLDANGNIRELRNYNNSQTIIPAIPASLPAVQRTPDLLISALDPAIQPVARRFYMREQIVRDRRMGFVPSGTPTDGLDLDGQPSTTNDNVSSSSLSLCSAPALNTGTTVTTDPLRLLCPGQPKFPSLGYIFPDNTVPQPNADRTTTNVDVNNGEPYIRETRSIPQFNVRGGFVQISNSDIEAIANDFRPKERGSWTLPTDGNASVSTGDANIDNAFRVFDQNNNALFVPLLDKGIFDGREMMSVRVLDIDLQRLRNNSIGSDRWLPNSGVIYAFREDAVREDGISRRSAGDYTDPNNPIRTNATNPNDPTDPQIKPNGISPKAVDFHPDPDRRPYGFRLRNGAELSRPDIPDKYTQRGLTFVSDNSVYIQGDFNRHSEQEFSETLGDSFDANQFYGRSNLNTNFATGNNDTWRPSEILADSITLLSKDFRDGNIASGLSGSNDLSSGGSNRHSYRGQNPMDNRTRFWVRENGLVAQGNETSTATNPYPGLDIPIKISRTGQPLICSSPPGNGITPCRTPAPYTDADVNVDFADQSRKDKINAAAPTQINATLVSGIVPARSKQGNGGFQNFPRFLENWSGVRMGISGSFIQLNFSTAATAPFEQEAWEPNQTPNDSNQFRWYYEPPNRAWGYDVGLQYAPAGPLSKRLVPVGAPRSEFYEEPKANDPYICMLRKAIAGRETFNEPSATVQQECQQ
ncbi:MAG TPA: hypothetical protein DCY88_15315 [Cyanobacteria bacterium UBA11372]|nr:hypothetical protein [Cyanobacteria bacterium UBA11372]